MIWVALSAFFGGVCCASLGWLDSKEPFNSRKFGASILRAFIAGVVFAIGYSFADSITGSDIGVAFLGGAGVDAMGNHLTRSFRK